jgi:tRNA-specific 2-thiouridylase
MKTKMAKVLVGLSGGLDSTYTAYLLQTRGYEVHGVHFYNKTIKPECQETIQNISKFLNIPVEYIDLHERFDSLLTSIDIEMCHMKTPNVCIMCARDIKFGYVNQLAIKKGYQYFATGHYVRIAHDGQNIHVLQALDKTRDQSYGFGVIPKESLVHALTPLGDYIKTDIRQHAVAIGLPHIHSESHGICFVPPKTTFNQFYKEYTKCGLVKGKFIIQDSGYSCDHEGQQLYTSGQRVVINNKPYFVERKTENGNITLTKRDNLLTNLVQIKNINWFEHLNFDAGYQILIRYNADIVGCMILATTEAGLLVETDKLVYAPTEGQVATIYDGDMVVCGGFIYT